MKSLLIAEQRQGKLLESTYELLGFAGRLNSETAMLLVGSKDSLPVYAGKLYLADVSKYGDYNPDVHQRLILEAIQQENPDLIVFLHSSYGWDLAPRVAGALKLAQLSEVVDLADGKYVLSSLNAKMHRWVAPKTSKVVITIQSGAFAASRSAEGTPQVEALDVSDTASKLEFGGYEVTKKEGLDLTRAEVIVSAGRGIGKKENLPIVEALAKALGGELGATRPIVDAGWLDHSHQVGTTGQIVHPKLYVACGISGSIQHIAGMKQSDFIVAINKDKDAPIGTVADVLVVADVTQFVPVLTNRLQK